LGGRRTGSTADYGEESQEQRGYAVRPWVHARHFLL